MMPAILILALQGQVSDDVARELYVARSLHWLHVGRALENSLNKSSIPSLMKLLNGPQFFSVPDYTNVECLAEMDNGDTYKVRLLEGPHKGQVGYLDSIDFKPGSASKEEVTNARNDRMSTADAYLEASETEEQLKQQPRQNIPAVHGFRRVSHFEGVTSQETDTFTIPRKSRCYIVWKSKSNIESDGNTDGAFSARLKKPYSDEFGQLVANTTGTQSDRTNVYKHGTYYISVDATERWTIDVYEN